MTEVLLAVAVMVGLILVLTLAVLGARRVLVPELPVTITVNGGRAVPAVTGQKLLSALQEGGLAIPSGCAGKGTCGLCRVEVPEGGGAALPPEEARLGHRAVAEGARLACQLVVRGPLSVTVPPEMLSAETFPCRVVSNDRFAPLITELVLEAETGETPAMRAGAFVQVTAPPYRLAYADLAIPAAFEGVWGALGLRTLAAGTGEAVSRAYSIANRPEDAGRIVMNVRLAIPPNDAPEAPPGVVSSWLFGLKPGDRVETAGPFGDFGARDSGAEMVFIGGGVGMAPLRAIIHDRIASGRPMRFFYGARTRADLYYEEEFAHLAARHPNFGFTPALSDPAPEDGWEGATGFVHEVAFAAYLGEHPAPETCDYYLCGPPLMIRAVTTMLDDLGVGPERIFYDDFTG